MGHPNYKLSHSDKSATIKDTAGFGSAIGAGVPVGLR